MSPSEIVFQFLPLAQSPIISVGFGTSFAFKSALGSPTSGVLNTTSLLPRRTIAQCCSARTPSRKDIVCIPLYVPAQKRLRVGTRRSGCSGTVPETRGGRFLSHFTIMSAHINHKCAGRRFICTNLLLLHATCASRSERVVLAGDFNKGAHRSKTGQVSPIEAVSAPALAPWPTVRHEPLMGARRRRVAQVLRLPQFTSHS